MHSPWPCEMAFELQNVGSGVSGFGFVYSRPEIRELSLRPFGVKNFSRVVCVPGPEIRELSLRPFELFADGPELGSLRARLSELRISVLEGRAGRQKLRFWGVCFKVWNFGFRKSGEWFRVPDAVREGCLRGLD